MTVTEKKTALLFTKPRNKLGNQPSMKVKQRKHTKQSHICSAGYCTVKQHSTRATTVQHHKCSMCHFCFMFCRLDLQTSRNTYQ